MNQTIDELRRLSITERIQLVEDIWDSIALDSPDGVPLTPAQREEIQHRLLAHDADASTAVSWEQVRAELFKRNH